MDNYIILAVLVLTCAIAIIETVKHFTKKKGCCGGGDYKVKKKKLNNVKYQKTFRVDGMHCEKCKARVEEIVDDIGGISGVVDLKTGVLIVSYEIDVDDSLIIERIERVGYKVTKKET